MTLDALIMLSGAFVALLPFLGFPNNWDTVLFFLAGIFIISLGIAIRRKDNASPQAKNGTFVENAPQKNDLPAPSEQQTGEHEAD